MSQRKRNAKKTIAPGTTVEQATAGTIIRMEQPKSKRQSKTNVVIVAAQDINPVTGFTKFIRDYGVIGVAVGFAIASQAQLLIKSLIDNLITPTYTLLFNTGNPQKQISTIHFRDRAGTYSWGLVITQLINFFFVLAVIYALVRLLGLHKLDKDKSEDSK